MSYSEIMNEKISKMIKEAQMLYETNQHTAAIAKLTRAIALQPLNSDLFENRAKVLVQLRQYDLAIANFQKVLSLRGEDSEILDQLGEVHWLYGEQLFTGERFGLALEVFEQASVYRPEDKQIVMRRISCLLALERYEQCFEMIKMELEVDDSNPDLYIFRAKLKLLFGNTTDAYYDVCSALNLEPTHTEALTMKAQLAQSAMLCKNQAVHHSLVGRKLDALKKISIAIESDPTVAEYHIFRGALYRRLKDFEAAVDDFLTAMDKVSHQQDCDVYRNATKQLVLTYNDFAMECFRQRHFNEAILLLNKAIKEEKMEKGLYLNRGDCFYRLNNLPFALTDYQTALELEPTNWEVSCRIGIVCCELGVECFGREQYSKAEELFSAAIRHNPKVCRFYVCRAQTRFALKNLAGTEEDLMVSLILEPNNEECISLISRAFPGKTKDILLQSHEAEERRRQLQLDIRKLSCHEKSEQSSCHCGVKTLTKLINELELKFEDLKSSESQEKNYSLAIQDTQPPTQSSDSHPHNVAAVSTQSDCEGRTAEVLETVRREEKIIPQEWSVLSHPLPELTSDPQGVMPVLKECLQEHSFHKKIYYSKKIATDVVRRVLRSPPKFTRTLSLNRPLS